MALFGLLKPNVQTLENRADTHGLLRALGYKSDPEIREHAAWALFNVLGRYQDTEATEPLIGALRDPSEAVRAKAAVALTRLPSERVVDALIIALSDYSLGRDFHIAVIESLGKIGNCKAVGPLLEELQLAKQLYATDRERLGEAPPGIPFVVPLGEALRRFQDARAIAAYLELVDLLHKDPALYDSWKLLAYDLTATEELEKIKPIVFAEVLQSMEPAILLGGLRAVRRSYVYDTVEVVRSVLKLVNHPEKEVRCAAREALEGFYDKEGVEEMSRCPEAEVRLLARVKAEKLKDREVQEALNRAAQVRDAARPDYERVILGRAPTSGDRLAGVRAALTTAEGQRELSPELLPRLLSIYRDAEEKTYWGRNRTSAEWLHVEQFEHTGARKQFEEQKAIKESSRRVIERMAHLPGGLGILKEVGSKIQKEGWDPLDDSAHEIAHRNAALATLQLIDRLAKS